MKLKSVLLAVHELKETSRDTEYKRTGKQLTQTSDLLTSLFSPVPKKKNLANANEISSITRHDNLNTGQSKHRTIQTECLRPNCFWTLC